MRLEVVGCVLEERTELLRDWRSQIPVACAWQNPELFLATLGVEGHRRADASVRDMEVCAASTVVITINQ